MIDLKVSLPTATAFVLAGIIVSGFTDIWLWPVGLIGIGISVITFSFNLVKIGLGILLASSIVLLIAVIFYSGWITG